MKQISEIHKWVRALLDKKVSPKVFAIVMATMLIINVVMLFGHGH